jgi:hypothetical protein
VPRCRSNAVGSARNGQGGEVAVVAQATCLLETVTFGRMAEAFAIKMKASAIKNTTPNPRVEILQQGYNPGTKTCVTQTSEPLLLDVWNTLLFFCASVLLCCCCCCVLLLLLCCCCWCCSVLVLPFCAFTRSIRSCCRQTAQGCGA